MKTALFKKVLGVLTDKIPSGKYPDEAVRRAAMLAACIGVSLGGDPFRPEYLAYFAEVEECVRMLDDPAVAGDVRTVLLWICGGDEEAFSRAVGAARRMAAESSADSAARRLDKESFNRFAMLRRIVCGECICNLADAIAAWRAGQAMRRQPGHAGQDFIEEMRDEVAEARDRGVTWAEIARVIERHTGRKAKPKTLSMAFSRIGTAGQRDGDSSPHEGI